MVVVPCEAAAGVTCTKHLYKAEDVSLGAAHTEKLGDQEIIFTEATVKDAQ